MKRTPLRRRIPLRARVPLRRAAHRGSAAPPRSKYRSRPRHTDFRLWVKRQHCLMRAVWGCCSGSVEADHAGRRGVGRKAHDSNCIRLCRYHYGAPRFPRSWPQDRRRAWLHAAVVYTQAVARAAGVIMPLDPAPMTEYPTTPLDLARVALADVEVLASFKAPPGDHPHPSLVALVALANSEISKIITGARLIGDAGWPGSFALGQVRCRPVPDELQDP